MMHLIKNTRKAKAASATNHSPVQLLNSAAVVQTKYPRGNNTSMISSQIEADLDTSPETSYADLAELKPCKSGYVTSVPIPFDMYGTGSIKMLFLTGFGMTRASWCNQLRYFAAKPDYSCLVVDTRGYDKFAPHIPLRIPSIEGYARDMKTALEELGWNMPRSVHVVGFSMGGMIALQMGRICSEYIASLHLVSTCRTYRSPEFNIANLANTLSLLKRTPDEKKKANYLDLLFPASFLYAHDANYPEFVTNRDRFLQNGVEDKLFAGKQNRWNYYTQAWACERHKLSQAMLWEISSKIRFIFVSGADNDALMKSDCAQELMIGLSAPGRMYDGGHMILWQHSDAFNTDQEAMMLRATREYREYPPVENTPEDVFAQVTPEAVDATV